MKDPDVPTADICERFGVSKATMFRAPLHGYVV